MIIEELSFVTDTKKKHYRMKLDGKTYRAFDGTEAYKQMKAGEMTVGDNIDPTFNEEKSEGKDGKTITYRYLQKLKKLEGEPEPKKESSGATPQSGRPPTESERIVRQNSLAHADARARMHFDKEKVLPSEEAYFQFAENCFNWVMGRK